MAVETVTEIAAEQVAENLEVVADRLDMAAGAARQIDARAVKFFVTGSTFGLIVGFFFGYRWNREKIKAEAFKKSEVELEQMRQHYDMRVAAAKAEAEKPSIEELVEEKGYVVIEEEQPEQKRLRPVVPFVGEASPRPKRTADGEKSKDEGWNYPRELSKRSPDRPYIIHQDEFHTNETGYQQVTYSYYAGDNVITDEHDTVIENADNLIGLDNLNRWGHGADDINVLYIRNSTLELEFEICRTPKSYEEEVLGLEHSEYGENYERRPRKSRHDRGKS